MTEKVTTKRTKAYLVQVSRGEPIQIDAEELEKVLQAMQKGNPVVLKQGIVNPSYITSIVKDRARIEAYIHEKNYDEGLKENGMKALPDLVGTNDIAKRLGGNNKQIPNG